MGDNVNHPDHYQNIAGVEAIDILNDVVKDLPGKQAAMLWNTLKYFILKNYQLNPMPTPPELSSLVKAPPRLKLVLGLIIRW